MSQFFASGGHSIGVSASTSVLPKNIVHVWREKKIKVIVSLSNADILVLEEGAETPILWPPDAKS